MNKLLKLMIICTSLLLIIILFIYYKNETMVPVLGYHGVFPGEKNEEMVMDTKLFEHQIKILKKLGYKSMSLDEYYCWHNKKCSKPHRAVLITFDDGYVNNYKYAFPILKKYNMKAVVFVVGSYIEKDNNGFLDFKHLKKIKKEYPNIEIASHTYNHHDVDADTYKEVDKDAKLMKSVVNTVFLSYPHGHYNNQYIKALKDNGYKMAFTFGPDREHRKSSLSDNAFKIPRLNISNGMSDVKFKLRLLLPM